MVTWMVTNAQVNPAAWLRHQKKNYQLHSRLTQIENIVKSHLDNILKDLSETVPSLARKVPTKLTMKQKEAMKKENKQPETDLNGDVVMPRYACVTSHTARRSGITNMYLTHKYTILQMMHVSGHKT